jgi:hypothetical protein
VALALGRPPGGHEQEIRESVQINPHLGREGGREGGRRDSERAALDSQDSSAASFKQIMA